MSRLIRVVRRVLGAIALGAVVLVCVLLVRTARFRSRLVPVAAVGALDVDADRVAEHLAEAIRRPTVSHAGAAEREFEPFVALHDYLKATFPEAATRLRWETIGGASLLITWEGLDPTLKPLLLMAHLDVVPAGSDPAEAWAERAFRGDVDSTYIWGRGTLDDKVSVLAILEAAEILLKQNHAPRRTVLLALGHDEEVGGRQGAARIAAELARRSVHPECIVDEGSTLVEKLIPGIDVPVAAIGIAEKGYVDVALAVAAEGGHSSMPPPHTAIGILSQAISRLEDHPYPAHLDGISWQTFEVLGPELPFGPRLALANTWLFGPLVERQLATAPSMNALIRTTTAVTLIQGGTQDNVLPRSAGAVVNFRLLPGDTSKDLLDHVSRAIADPRVQVGFADPKVYSKVFEASRVSPTDSAAYATLKTTIRQCFKDALVVPTLVIAGTDARHYEGLCDNIYRFLPIRLGLADLDRIHGKDERIARANYIEVIRFYYNLIKNFTSPDDVLR